MRKISLLLLALVCTVGAWGDVPALKVSTEGGAITYYTIKNYRSNKYAKWAGDNVQIQQTADLEEACYWYVLANGDDGYTLCNKATTKKYAAYNSFTADGAKTYIMENPYKSGYWCVSLTSNLSANCWDDQGGGTTVGNYNPRPNDNDGTSWIFEEYTGDLEKELLAIDVNNAKVGTDPGCYSQEALDEARAVLDNELGGYAEARKTLKSKVIVPVAGKYYRITSVYRPFEQQQGVTKSMYADGENILSWKTTDLADETMLWEIYHDGSKYVFKNYSTQKSVGAYSSGPRTFAMVDEADANADADIVWYENGICNISIGGGNCHANNHNNGAGVSGNIIQYGSGTAGVSAWRIIEAELDYTAAYAELESRLSALKTGKQLGTNPGQYTMSGVEQAAYEAAVKSASDVLNNTASTATDLSAALRALNEVVPEDVAFTQHGMEVGKYYRIQSTTRGTYTGVVRNVAKTGTSKMWNSALVEDNPGQIWKLEQDGENYFLVNVLSGLYPQEVKQGPSENAFVGSKNVSYKFTWSISAEPTATTEPVHRICFGGNPVNIEEAGNVNKWDGNNARHYIRAVDKTDEEVLALVNAWVASQNMTANAGAETIFIAENAAEVISPNEFADAAVVNNAIDALKAYTEAEAPTLEQAQAVYNNCSIVDTYKSATDEHGSLLSITYTAPNAEYGTIILPINFSTPAGWTRYTCAAASDGRLDLVENTDGENKNTPYIVKFTAEEQGKVYQLIGYSNGAATENQTQGLLTGVLEDGAKVPAGSYILSKHNDTLGFYKVGADANYDATKYKCYLTLDAESAARFEALFFDGTATAIEGVQDTQAKQDGGIYNMAGQRLGKLQKGLNIVNGKVVLVK